MGKPEGDHSGLPGSSPYSESSKAVVSHGLGAFHLCPSVVRTSFDGILRLGKQLCPVGRLPPRGAFSLFGSVSSVSICVHLWLKLSSTASLRLIPLTPVRASSGGNFVKSAALGAMASVKEISKVRNPGEARIHPIAYTWSRC